MITILLTASGIFVLILSAVFFFIRQEILRLTAMVEEGNEAKSFVDTMPDIPLIMKDDGEIIFSGPQMKKYGFLPEDLVGRKFQEFVHTDDRRPIEDFFKDMQLSCAFECVFRLEGKSGDPYETWFEIRMSPDEKDGKGRIIGIMRDITGSKYADDTLRENEARYKALSDAALDSIFILKDGLFIDCNTRTGDAFGLTKEDIIGKSPAFFSPEYQPDGRRSDEKAAYFINRALGGKPQIFEWVHTRGDGSELHAEVSLTRVSFRRESYVLGIVRDLSERKVIEGQILNLVSVVEQAAESVIITDLEGNIEYVNPAFEKKTGFLRDEIIGKKPSVLKSGSHSPEFYKDMWDTILRGSVWRGVIINMSKDGKELIEDSLLSSIRNNDGIMTGFLAVKRDVTEEYRLQEKLKASEELFRAVFENAPYAMSLSSLRDQKYVAVNPAFVKSTGLGLSVIIGRTADELGFIIHDFDHEAFFESLTKTGTVNNQPLRFIDPSGKEKFIIFSSALLEYKGELCVLTMSVDVTESKRLEERLRQSQKMDAIGQLAGGIAHDFNNMLSGILGGAELISFLLPSESPLRKHTETIAKSAGMASALTKKLLAFSRKGLFAEMASVDVHECINMTVSILERSLDKSIGLEAKLFSPKSVIRGEASLLQNAFLNLGINARDAMKNGGRLTFSTSEIFLDEYFCMSNSFSLSPGNYILIEVSDTGSGIPKRIMDRIFEPFFTTKEPGKGTGLGLAAVYGTVKEHGGDISVYSEEGKGTVFRIYLPLLVLEGVEPSDNCKDAAIVSGSGCVLLVDDEPLVRDIACEILKSLGYEVITASDGKEAISIYETERTRISIILMDMVMPWISGLETFRRLRAKFPDARVVLTSGFTQEGIRLDLSEPGVMGFIIKPYRVSELSRVIASAVEDHS